MDLEQIQGILLRLNQQPAQNVESFSAESSASDEPWTITRSFPWCRNRLADKYIHSHFRNEKDIFNEIFTYYGGDDLQTLQRLIDELQNFVVRSSINCTVERNNSDTHSPEVINGEEVEGNIAERLSVFFDLISEKMKQWKQVQRINMEEILLKTETGTVELDEEEKARLKLLALRNYYYDIAEMWSNYFEFESLEEFQGLADILFMQ